MSFSTERFFSLTLLVLFSAVIATAQQSYNISGELTAEDSTGFDQFTVEVVTVGSHSAVARAFVTSSGRFEIRSLAPGTYRLEVKDGAGDIVMQDSLVPSQLTSNIRLTVPSRLPKSTPIAGVISAASLNHKTPRKALNQMAIAQTYKNSGDHPKAIEHLLLAVEIDPKSAEAHTNLGAEYGRIGNYLAAREQFTTIIQLGLRGSPQYCNLAVAELGLNETETAESSLRTALAVDSRYPQANYLMGKILAERPDRYDDAIRFLRLAAPELPAANLVLAQTYIRAGHKQDAIDALTLYESSAPPATKTKVEEMIRSLK
jgi:tetratricopeptide (TPR) repeat protein